ncbi:hypothetical protein DL771_006952 [Monosporascus sp. 5C6A]|nr:hypothetical protein DL771_006952 [Monosporascus sp. 5C6A]
MFTSTLMPFGDSAQPFRVTKWMVLLAILTVTIVLWLLWAYVLRLYLLRRFYEKQGIPFVKGCYAVVGAEMRVTSLHHNNKSHDWLYTDQPTDLYGTVRGFSLQLYTTSADFCEALIAKTGHHVDRDTPALFSFGRLSPFALTFLPTHKWRWRERKATLIRAMTDNKRLFDIVSRQAEGALAHFKVQNGSGVTINIRELLNHWTRESSGEFIWGRNNINRNIEVYDENHQLKSTPFMTALNLTFTDLRFNAGRFWHRVSFPLAGLPVSKETRRLTYNIKQLHKATVDMMTTCEPETVAYMVQQAHAKLGIPPRMTQDDLVAGTIAGLDTIKATVMGAVFHLLEPANMSWKQQILEEINELKATTGDMYLGLSQAPKLNAFILEAMRYEPPGSLINNAAVKDFDLSVNGREYKIKAGTRIVSCIHALHLDERSWQKRVAPNMAPLEKFDPGRFLEHKDTIAGSFCFMPFGKGLRRCPGQGAGLMMVKVFVATFISHNFNARMAIPDDQTIDMSWFNIHSKATFDIVCDNEHTSMEALDA